MNTFVLKLTAAFMPIFIIIAHIASFSALSVKGEAEVDYTYRRAAFTLTAIDVPIDNSLYGSDIERGAAALMVLRALVGETKNDVQSLYSDVSSNDEYASDFAMLSNMGIIGGYSDGSFRPHQPLLYEEAAKMLVCALGYSIVAEERGGYPSGYTAVAAMNGIFKNVRVEAGKSVSYSDFVKIMVNFLNANPMEHYMTFDRYRVNSETTVLDYRLTRLDRTIADVVVTGLVYDDGSANGSDKIELDGALYINDAKADGELLGYCVTAAIQNEDITAQTLLAVLPNERMNSFLEIDSIDFVSASFSEIVYTVNDRDRTVKFSSAPFVVRNGTLLSALNEDDLIPLNGSVLLIDNNGDGKYEYLHVTAKEYFEIERTSVENNVIFLKDGVYRNASAIYIDETAKENRNRIETSDGNVVAFETLAADDRFALLSGGKSTRLVILPDIRFTAMAEEISDEEYGVLIDGEAYRIADKADGGKLFNDSELKFGKNYYFFADGRTLIGFEEVDKRKEYGFVIDAKAVNGISGSVKYQILAADKKIYIGELADRVIYNGKSFKKDDVPIKIQIPIAYETNKDGQITKIEEALQYGARESRRYMEETNMFLSMAYNPPMFITDETNIFVVPDSGLEEDYKAFVRLRNNEQYIVSAYDFDEERLSAGVLVVYSDISYDMPGVITRDSVPVILSRKTIVADDNEATVYKLYWLEGEEEKSAFVKSTAAINAIAKDMSVGDVFLYSLSSIDYVDNIEILLELKPEPEYFHRGEGAIRETVFGTVLSVFDNQLPSGSLGRIVKTLKLQVENGIEKSFIISSKEPVSYYLYNSASNTIKTASFGDILPSGVTDIQPSRVFIYYISNETKAVIIVK